MSRAVKRGLVAGLIAGAVFALWLLILDVLKGQPLATPAYMSGLVFSFTTALPATARLIGFTILHLIAFGIIGILVSLTLRRRGLRAIPIGLALTLALAFGGLLFGVVYYAGTRISGVDIVRALGWWEVLTANIVAGLALFGYLRRR